MALPLIFPVKQTNEKRKENPKASEKETAFSEADCQKEPSLSVSFQKRIGLGRPVSGTALRASLTVETALVLPFFLFMMIALIYLGEALRFSGNVQASLHQTARKFSTYAYAMDKVTGGKSIPGGSLAISLTAGRSMTLSDLEEKYISESPVEGGSGGISFIHSSVLKQDQMVDLVANYQVKVPFSFLQINGFKVADRARIRAFTGYDNTQKEDLGSDEEIVFVTEHGSVYHRSKDCSHLKITIKQTSKDALPGERNESGGKYYACEFCGAKKGSGVFYITTDGDRYHTSLSCPGLKRSIQAVPISKTGGRPPCSECGGK
ncbi:MAG: pilus assembly protein [Lachnospiraceae bacterium]|nr:pilus assembly protein [Lachnospiraceae bacterium]